MDKNKVIMEIAAALNGYFCDVKNGVNLSFTVEDLCYTTVYNFGIMASIYVVNKNPKSLSRFLAKYSSLNKKDNFTYPTNIETSKIEDATILANALLEICHVVTSKDVPGAMKKAPKDIFEDMFDLFGEIFPKYTRNSNLDIRTEFNDIMKVRTEDIFESRDIIPISAESVFRNFAFVNYSLVTDKYIDDIFLLSLFSMPINNANMIQYVSFLYPISRYGENPSNYMGGILSNTRKCKTFSEFLNLADEYIDKKIENIVEDFENNLISEKEKKELLKNVNDNFLYETTTILLLNQFHLFEDISKADIINALQVRCAFNKYNGEEPDEINYNKMVSDVIVSVLARKLKECTLKKNVVTEKSTKIFVDENKEVKLLESKNKDLEEQNKLLQEKIEVFKRKEGKENSRMESLEQKIRELELSLMEKKEEIKVLEELLESSDKEEREVEDISTEQDYHSLLESFTKENSVVFVGGNYNLISKMRGVLPDITYIVDNEKTRITDELIRNARLVLFKTDSLAHSSFESVISKCDRCDTPFGYLKNLTNTNALEKNMVEVIQTKLEITL